MDFKEFKQGISDKHEKEWSNIIKGIEWQPAILYTLPVINEMLEYAEEYYAFSPSSRRRVFEPAKSKFEEYKNQGYISCRDIPDLLAYAKYIQEYAKTDSRVDRYGELAKELEHRFEKFDYKTELLTEMCLKIGDTP